MSKNKSTLESVLFFVFFYESFIFFFQAKKKEAKKLPVITTAAVSRIPQRFKVNEKNKRSFYHCRDFLPRPSE